MHFPIPRLWLVLFHIPGGDGVLWSDILEETIWGCVFSSFYIISGPPSEVGIVRSRNFILPPYVKKSYLY